MITSNSYAMLPRDIQRLIAGYLNAKELSVFACACRRFNEIANEPRFEKLRYHVLVNRNVRDMRYEVREMGYIFNGDCGASMGNHLFTCHSGILKSGKSIFGSFINVGMITKIGIHLLIVRDGDITYELDFSSPKAKTHITDKLCANPIGRLIRLVCISTVFFFRLERGLSIDNYRRRGSLLNKTISQFGYFVFSPWIFVTIMYNLSSNQREALSRVNTYFTPRFANLIRKNVYIAEDAF